MCNEFADKKKKKEHPRGEKKSMDRKYDNQEGVERNGV